MNWILNWKTEYNHISANRWGISYPLPDEQITSQKENRIMNNKTMTDKTLNNKTMNNKTIETIKNGSNPSAKELFDLINVNCTLCQGQIF